MTTTVPKSDMQTYLEQISAYSFLTAFQERELGWRVMNDDDQTARDALVNANLRLVVAISRTFQHRGLSLTDLIAEGNIGLVRAADGFDPAHGVRFSTYATLPIKQAIRTAAFAASQTCYVPAYMGELIARCQATSKRLEAAHNRPPTPHELAEVMGIPIRSLKSIRRAQRARNVSTQSSIEFNGGRLDSTDLLEDTRAATPQESGAQHEAAKKIMRLLDSGDARHTRVLKMRLGLGVHQPQTLLQIGRELGITTERVRQIELKARRRLHELMADVAGDEYAEHLAA